MKKEIADKWVTALRSGKYKQTKEYLKNEEGFCCLGVLCDISGLGDWKETVESGKTYHDYNAIDDDGYLSRSFIDLDLAMQKFAGMRGDSGNYDPVLVSKPEWKHFNSLADLNDKGLSFEEIADFIETHWEIL